MTRTPLQVFAAVCWAWMVMLLSSGCNPQPTSQAQGSAPAVDPLDPFGWSTQVERSPREDLSPLVSGCRQGSQVVEQVQKFAEPCRLVAQGLPLKFDRYVLDGNKRVVAISGMHPEADTLERLQAILNTPGGVAQYAGVCIRLGNNTLPELTIVSKDHCEQLNLGLL